MMRQMEVKDENYLLMQLTRSDDSTDGGCTVELCFADNN